jgi:hypothetical protein
LRILVRVHARRGEKPRQDSAHRKEQLDAKDVKEDAAVHGVTVLKRGIDRDAGASRRRRR